QAVRAGLAPPRATLVGSVGRRDEQKGYEYLVGAARRVVDQRPDVYFAVAGEGPSRPALERLVAESGLDGRFRLPGFVDDVTSFLSALDVFVSSSLWEGLPLAIVEAMLLGRPVVATDVGGSPEAVIPGRTGTLVPARDADALAEAILGSLDPPGGPALVVRHAKQRAAAPPAPPRPRPLDRADVRPPPPARLQPRDARLDGLRHAPPPLQPAHALVDPRLRRQRTLDTDVPPAVQRGERAPHRQGGGLPSG